MTAALLAIAIACPGHGHLAPHVLDAAERYRMDPVVLVAIMKREARCRMDLVGAHGERCAFQLHGRARDGKTNAELADPRTCIMTGARWYSLMRDWCRGRESCALVAYNTGDRCVRNKDTPKCRAGRRYARKVQATARRIRREMQRRDAR